MQVTSRSALERPIRHLIAHWGSNDSILALPRMRALFFARLVSSMGTAGALLAVAYLSFQHSNSIIHTVIVAAAYSLPAVVLGPWSARLADTHDRRRIVIITYAAEIAVWMGVLGLQLAGWLDPAWLTLTSALAGAAAAIQYPAWQELERGLVPDNRLHEANAVFSSAGSIARVVGAVAGGFVLTWSGPAPMFAFNGISYIPMMLIIAHLSVAQPTARPGGDRRIGLRGTIAYARSQPEVRQAILLVVLITLLAVPISSLLPAVADELGSEGHVLGVLVAFYSLGGSLVAAALTRLTKRYDERRLVSPAVMTCALSLLVIGLTGDELGSPGRQIAVVGLLVPIGLGLAMAQAVLSSTVQLSSSAEMEGQVLALYGATVSLVAPIGAITLAAVAERRDVWESVAISGALLAAVSLAVALRRRHAATTAPDPSVHGAALVHAAHRGRFAAAFLQPREFSPLTGRPADDQEPPAVPAAPRRDG